MKNQPPLTTSSSSTPPIQQVSPRRMSTPARNGSGSGSGSNSLDIGGSGQNQVDLAEAEAKRRKIQRACDVCRRKKIKCDGPMNSLSASKCAHCQEYGLDCTYVEAAKRRGPPKGYLDTLEQRCGRLERILRQLYPSVDFSEYVGPLPDRDDFDLNTYRESLRSLQIPPYPAVKPFKAPSRSLDSQPGASELPDASPDGSTTQAGSPPLRVLGSKPWIAYEQDPSRPPEEGDTEEQAAIHLSIATTMSKLDVRDAHWRYHGKASGAHLMRTFHELKYRGLDTTHLVEGINSNKRPEYWQVPEWEVVIANEGLNPLDWSIWPEPGLDIELIDAYFDHVNLHLPLLNHIWFKRQYDSRLYKSNHGFARVCLMVFANGARFIDDPRVLWPTDLSMTTEGKERLKSDTDGTLRYSAGWHFIRALLRMGRSILHGPNLYEFQTQVLICQFLQGSAIPHLMWILSGIGLRSAQELGIHVRATLMHADPIERALYNRAFWCLYHIDRVNCAAIGRSVAIQDTDFDADYPIDVDDEYWDTGDPARNFKQPEGARISKVAAFTQMLKLDHITGAALRTIYAINKLPEHRADVAAQRAVVVELDSALNSWADNVPDELRWDPTRADYRIFSQSAVLYAQYYYCQILVHRPFIPTPSNQVSAGLPSLAICANAARSICNILDASLRRGRQEGELPGRALNVAFMIPAAIANIVLLINIYSGKQTPKERERAVGDIKRCIAAMKELEMTWRLAGKMTDMMVELAREPDMPKAGGVDHGEKRAFNYENESVLGRSRSGDEPQVVVRPNGGAAPPLPPIDAEDDALRRVHSSHTPQQGDISSRSDSSPSTLQSFAPPTHESTSTSRTATDSSSSTALPTPVNGYATMDPPHQNLGYGGPINTPSNPISLPSQQQQQQYYQSSSFPQPQMQNFDTLFDPQSFETQLMGLGNMTFGAQEMPGETDVWTQLFSDYTGQDIQGLWTTGDVWQQDLGMQQQQQTQPPMIVQQPQRQYAPDQTQQQQQQQQQQPQQQQPQRQQQQAYNWNTHGMQGDRS
ncbi:hypothetical protein CI109_100415 [Kwoniella shandongensis]|uniref:Uncharacterized protein n=1 Tax=Kwoniella shandongensis TaxID=1734106 RepID=A0A5M6C4W6_9TREE|nr:uncharacterized protein CI109_001740 [Kwoniella shandongensis]KAA5529800.1 hypothetical protein CI109_001740 [Kwoniella shandongensis]